METMASMVSLRAKKTVSGSGVSGSSDPELGEAAADGTGARILGTTGSIQAGERVDEEQVKVEVLSQSTMTGLKLFGIEFQLSSETKFVVLCSGAIVSALAFAALQENVFRLKHFHYAGLITLLTSLSYTACGFVERVLTNDLVRRYDRSSEHTNGRSTFEPSLSSTSARRGSLKDYVLLSLLTFGGMYFTNWALHVSSLNILAYVFFGRFRYLMNVCTGSFYRT